MRECKLCCDQLGVAVIGEAVGHWLASERQVLIHPAQQQGAGIGSDLDRRSKAATTPASAGAGLIDNFRLWGSSPWRQMTAPLKVIFKLRRQVTLYFRLSQRGGALTVVVWSLRRTVTGRGFSRVLTAAALVL